MKIIKYFIIYFFLIFATSANTAENFFENAKNLYEKEKYDDSKFLFQRNIVFNPKDAKSYLYLAKIFNFEENEKEEKKNLNTTLLLQSDNEEAMYMLINIYLKNSDYSKVKELKEKFSIICTDLCEKNKIIDKNLKDIEPKNESQQ